MGLKAAIYCRISRDATAEGLGVERQRQDCVERAQREGWNVVSVYTDNDIGASTRTRKKSRPEYKRMLADARAGKIDLICAYSTSRLTRRPMELEELIQLHEQRGVELRTVVSGDDDLSTADGRMVARIKAGIDAAESERLSERLKRAKRQKREMGLWAGGFPPFGYAVENMRLVVNPAQAQVMAEAAQRLLNGETLYGITRDFNRRGLCTAPSPKAPEGSAWTTRTLGRALTGNQAVGRSADGSRRAEPALDPNVWEEVRGLLLDPQRLERLAPVDWSTKRKHALSGIVTCGECGSKLSSTSRARGRTSMSCTTAGKGCGRIRIDYDQLAAFVVPIILARIDVPLVRGALSHREDTGTDDQVGELRRQLSKDERALERLDDDYADGVLDRQRYRRQVERIKLRMDEARETLASRLRDRAALLAGHEDEDIADVWDAHDATWQRTLLGQVVESIEILPHPQGVATTLTKFKAESDEDYAQRRQAHRERVLFQRVRVHFRPFGDAEGA